MLHFTSNGKDQFQNDSSTSLLNIKSNLDRVGLLSPTHDQRSQQSREITLQPILINKPKFLKATRHAEKKEIGIQRSMVVEALRW